MATRNLSSVLHELREHGNGANNGVRETNDLTDTGYVQEFEEEFVCRVCLGILQFVYSDGKGVLVEKNNAGDFAATIEDAVKKEGHEIDNFCLEVSLPPIVVEKEQAVWSYIEKKYSSESWFSEKFPSERIGVKDFLKLSVANPLEKLLDVKSNGSSFRICLTYTLSDASSKIEPLPESNGCSKRRKIGRFFIFGFPFVFPIETLCILASTSLMHTCKSSHGAITESLFLDSAHFKFLFDGTDDSDVLKNCTGLHEVEKHNTVTNSSIESVDEGNGFLPFPLEKVNNCCSLISQCYKTSIYVGGRYLKYSRNVSQSRWIIDDERMGEASVEEIIGGSILPICQGDSYKFHAAGREDIDVRMLGTGRPFLVEIQNARQFPSDVLIKDMEMKINSLERNLVKVKNLKFLGSQGWVMMREGEAEKQKQYAALVWISRPLNDDDVLSLSSFKDMQILQKTPVRVLHRRSPLGREKTIHWMKVERVAGSSQYFMLHLCTQAGTYIKEFVHGDLGRTQPSVGSILGCRAEILQLDVTDVKMDCFQT
ncbi:hypothetical protein MIMGU_mgv1a003989mg [Erythranthe guttata]|nr:hypothetical protein MIMGU_mgv1a003989mg [Erythranthe guttata]